uniref:Phospholysine phosphohistidine inorganic pyrophosphate phosphatase n=1 Tax=Vombatus ursinus TaxID=29139 RepID=A0A4X2ME70_VOMUR
MRAMAAAAATAAAWAQRLAGVRGLLLDVSGVLYDGGDGGGTAIPGSVEAVARIKQSGLKLRFCTNESQKSRDKFVGLLQRLGFDISVNEITSPAPAACQILKERGLRPYLLVHDDVLPEFNEMDTSNPNCVVIADSGDSFSYQNVNKAFRVLVSLENPVLISLGEGRYYKESDGLMLDVGPYVKALEYACDIRAEVVGKPAPEFFQAALREMGLEAHETIMIGDDIVSDVGGAQRCGIRALQVRTGKFSYFLILTPPHRSKWTRPPKTSTQLGQTDGGGGPLPQRASAASGAGVAQLCRENVFHSLCPGPRAAISGHWSWTAIKRLPLPHSSCHWTSDIRCTNNDN